jgi:hypothetical protein
VPSVATVLWIAGGLVVGYVVWKTGIAMLRSLTRPLPPPPPPGEMRKVNLRYPPPPRHCQEEMVVVAPITE